MNALNMKQMEHRLKFPWLNLIKKLKTILLFLYLSLIFSISTCRIVPRPKGMVVLHENIFKKYLLIKVILAFWFFYAKNYTREPRPCGLIYLVSRQEGTWPENLRVYCSWSYLGSPRRFSLVLYKEPQLLRRSNERIQLFQQTVRCSKEFPSPPFLWKQKKRMQHANFYHNIDSFFPPDAWPSSYVHLHKLYIYSLSPYFLGRSYFCKNFICMTWSLVQLCRIMLSWLARFG